MKEWGFAQVKPTDHLAHLHLFSICKTHIKGEVEFVITVHEYITPKDPELLLFPTVRMWTRSDALSWRYAEH